MLDVTDDLELCALASISLRMRSSGDIGDAIDPAVGFCRRFMELSIEGSAADAGVGGPGKVADDSIDSGGVLAGDMEKLPTDRLPDEVVLC